MGIPIGIYLIYVLSLRSAAEQHFSDSEHKYMGIPMPILILIVIGEQ